MCAFPIPRIVDAHVWRADGNENLDTNFTTLICVWYLDSPPVAVAAVLGFRAFVIACECAILAFLGYALAKLGILDSTDPCSTSSLDLPPDSTFLTHAWALHSE